MFRETDRDDSICYRDWRAEIEATLAKDYEPERVKIAMFKAMEGMAKDHAANIDQYGVLTALEILEGMDRLYRVSMTFQSLNAVLCGLQQRAAETCRDYYDHFTQITVLLRERHSNRFCPGKLARMSKDCFYAGLRAEHRPMVVHLKDHPNSTPLDLLVALMENEQNDMLANTHYPLATSSKTAAVLCGLQQRAAEHRPMVVHLKDHPNSTPLDLLVALMENEQNDMLANTHYPLATSSKTAAVLCGLQQRAAETCRDYYDQLWEYAIQTIPDHHAIWTNRTVMRIRNQEDSLHARCN